MSDAFHRLIHFVREIGWFWGLVISVVAAVASLALAAVVVVSWPPDRFTRAGDRVFLDGRHPVLRALAIAAKNVLGILLVLIGIVMALPGVPGQGFLTILIGITLVDFPGKRRIELSLIRRPAVFRAVNQLRQRFGHPPLQIEPS
jgi:hypothetical protein